MSFDDELRTGLDDAVELLPIDQTVALAAAKSQGRKGVRKRRVLAASGGVLTASALLVGALSLVQDSSPDTVVAGGVQLPSACDGAFPTPEGLDATRFEAVDERTWAVDGHTLVMTDSHQLDRENLIEGEDRFAWVPVGATDREVYRTLYAAPSITELGFAGMHLPAGCDVVLRLDAGIDEGGRLVLQEVERRLVWPASPEPEPLVVSDPAPVCGVVAPFQSAELDVRFDTPVAALGPEGQLTLRWADDLGTVEVTHPADPEVITTLPVPVHRDGPACDTASLVTSGDVSTREAAAVLRPVDPDLVDDAKRRGIELETSSKVLVNPDATAEPAVPTTVAAPAAGADTAD